MVKPKIVLLPGLDGTGNLLSDVVRELDHFADTTVIAHDRSVSDYETLLTSVKKELPDGPFWVVAESFSGPIGGLLAADPPEELKGVFFAATFVTPPSPWPAWSIKAMWLFPFHQRWALTLSRPLFLGLQKAPEIFEVFVQTTRSVPKRTLIERMVAVHKLPLRKDLSFKVPTFFLRAKNERFLWSACMRDLEARVDETIHYSAPHFLLQICPKRAAQDIIDRINGGSD